MAKTKRGKFMSENEAKKAGFPRGEGAEDVRKINQQKAG
jgi:hypothetical protein